ncbi:hypothetical protein F441_21405 [Phytophthora nicotianae CJ01A1]|uniref:Uncharacterized protein n=3 Tax=Phytophthora nicotianae TaxID=4792 RepID=W2FM75_PHYNI|nr:hypothetical protein L915_20920 [Phytophthora nicotianae]ETL25326.1 hypothetical protein L916_20803 [Phytophthora nicotianae]ETO60249.1 hypothetical protein F444_21533 [Phytophthora nicotianae P1976]ETP01329.1 hypothetical protein F441_21405 [Phytophthora nicotianae CJ01A1]
MEIAAVVACWDVLHCQRLVSVSAQQVVDGVTKRRDATASTNGQ